MIGCNNISNPSGEQGCEAHVFQQVVTHPRYYEPVRDWFTDLHDCALVKIYDASRIGSIIRINEDASVPDSVRDEPLTILGWGRTNYSERYSASDVLREATVKYIPNDDCKQISVTELGPAFNLKNRIFETSLCAADFIKGADTCHGDSGGPITRRGQNAKDDVQIGITSWGPIECGHPEYPAVYARISYFYYWIRETVCRLSLNPPEYFNCEAKPLSAKPDFSGELMTLTLEFLVDDMANETGWIVQSPNENGIMVTYSHEPIRTFPNSEAGVILRMNRTMSLPNNRYYFLTMLDSSGDGFNGENFELKLSTDSTTLLDERLSFKTYSLSFDFVLGTLPTPSPTVTPAPTMTPSPSTAPTGEPPFLWLVMDFDVRPEETGWRIEAISDDGNVTVTLREVYPGTYNGLTNISESVYLLPETPMAYRFTLTDNEANGICCGFGRGRFRLWLGEPSTGKLLVDEQDFRTWESSHEFVVNGTAEESDSIHAADSSMAVRHGNLVLLCIIAFVCLLYN